jgi:hypothetical protein
MNAVDLDKQFPEHDPPGRPRLAPEAAFPPYTFVRGLAPHPRTDPHGHSFGRPESPAEPLDPDAWEASGRYRRGIDLLNHGYYWEAHEAFEALWTAAGKTGSGAEFLKGLVKLAAAGVKVREGQAEGARRLLAAAAEHFRGVAGTTGRTRWAGLDLEPLTRHAEAARAGVDAATRAESARRAGTGHPDASARPVFDWTLIPGRD